MKKNKYLELIKDKKGLLIISGIILAIIFISITTTILYFNSYLNTSFNKESESVEIKIVSGEGIRDITKKLEKNGLVKDDLPLLIYLKLKGLAGDVKAGEYLIPKNSTPLQIIDILTNGKVASLKITIPEGWTTEEIGKYLEEKKIVSKADFLNATKEKYNYDFLKDLPEGVSVEGFLFPDTYQIPYKTNSEYIINMMLDNFDKKVVSELRNEISSTELNLFQTVVLASVVEREVSKPEDRKNVAGVFLSRLKEGMRLESDATVAFVLKTDKKILSYEDIKVDSLYNTYLVNGLPVGPIGNPGLESIQSVVRPQITQFRYFLSVDDVTYYSKTLEEHESKKERYLNQQD